MYIRIIIEYERGEYSTMWKESLRIGVDTVDKQHKMLFDKVGELIKEVRTNGTLNKDKCVSTINFLKEYAISHFADEETYQKSIDYIDFDAHKKLHERFIQTVLDYEKKIIASDFAVAEIKQFVGMLGAWLLYHVADADQRYINETTDQAQVGVAYSDFVLFSMSDALEKMANFSATSIKKVNSHDENCSEGFTVKIGLTGNAVGHITITYPLSFTKTLINAMMGFTPEYIGELERSALFEVTNIVSGSICRQITTAKGFLCNIKPPVAVDRTMLPSDEQITIDTGAGIVETIMAVSFLGN